MNEQRPIRLGGTLQAEAGLRYIPITARALGHNLAQVHIGPDQGWEPYGLSDDDIDQFRRLIFGVELYVHLPYILNLCETEPRKIGFQKLILKRFYQAATALGAKAVVVHPGSKKEADEAAARTAIVERLSSLSKEDSQTEILLETDAGSKNESKIGSVENISVVLTMLDDKDRFGMCLDTEHLYARGVDLRDKVTREDLMERYHAQIKLIHLNAPDPEVGLGSHLDRHNVSLKTWEGCEAMIQSFSRLPMVLERRSLSIQKQDVEFVRRAIGQKGVPT